MSQRSLLRRSPNSIAVLIALTLALLTIASGMVFLLALGLRSSSLSVESRALIPEPEFDAALHLPAVVLLAAICLLLFTLLWRYRRRSRRTVPPQV
jgi:ribose/xylose/arabinose/galactoside ABC-type transport system permease subunit